MHVTNTVSLSMDREKAFDAFINDFTKWWPQEYTWSQELLTEIRIGKGTGELCTEIGPDGFRCDWGRITAFVEHESVKLKWQIGPNREPVPNPEKASDIKIVFEGNEKTSTKITLKHYNFDNHGEASQKYREMMNSPQGWPYILERFKNYCEKKISNLH